MPQLSSLPRSFRLGLGCLVLVLLFGIGTGAAHLVLHHENRDARPGLTIDDVRGAYHGIQTQAPLLRALDRGHPEDLPPAAKQALSEWLHGEQLDLGFDDERRGELAPALIFDRHCLSCHSRQATEGDGIGKKIPLEYWDDVRGLAISRDVEPTGTPIVLASAHTHALAMGSLTVITLLLALGTRFSRRLLSPLAMGSGLGLLLDLGAWLPARTFESLVYVLVAGGGMWLACTTLLLLFVLADLLRPAGSTRVHRQDAQAGTLS
ncbi:MAG: hypothetical protein KDC98_13810 [Planctomycetes bacterium]|nr:hypothetical protein [Planctomycetota bacterium]